MAPLGEMRVKTIKRVRRARWEELLLQRRHLLAALVAGLATPLPVLAGDNVERIPLARAFRYLDSYLALAPTLRSRFHLVFLALRNEHLAPDLKAAIVRP